MNNQYKNDPRINASKLKLFAGRYFDVMVALNKLRNPSPPTEAMRLGTAVHAIVENKGDFTKCNFIVSPFENFRTKEAQNWKKENPDYMTEAEVTQARLMALRIISMSPEVKLESAKMEVEYYNGEYKALLDCVVGGHGLDWKTTSETSAEQWKRSANKFHYALQAAHYFDTAKLDEFTFVVVSSVEPYPVWRFKCTPGFLDYGRSELKIAEARYNKYKDCEIEPIYEELELDAPNWFGTEENNEESVW